MAIHNLADSPDGGSLAGGVKFSPTSEGSGFVGGQRPCHGEQTVAALSVNAPISELVDRPRFCPGFAAVSSGKRAESGAVAHREADAGCRAAVNRIFFTGSVPFTVAAYLQLFQAANASEFPRPTAQTAGRREFFRWRPRDIEWLSNLLYNCSARTSR